jgi:polysaccharide deacetylase family protein (PEP-CTERM system associated)
MSPLSRSETLAHFFTVDVEEYFQVGAFAPYVDRESWSAFESRVERGVDTLLEVLAERDCHASFFTLGWIAERNPQMIRRIAGEGHEVASHGWGHLRVNEHPPDRFREEVRSSKATLEGATGSPVFGFRAPNFSVIPGTEWAFDVLLEEGYSYDSSLFPIARKGYGYPSTPPDPFMIQRESGRLLEVPISIATFAGVPVPAAGGAYFRTFPFVIADRTFRRYSREGRRACFYIHPWELDPEQPRLGVDWFTERRHYGGLDRTLPKVERLLDRYAFTSIAEGLGLGRPDSEMRSDLPLVSLP